MKNKYIISNSILLLLSTILLFQCNTNNIAFDKNEIIKKIRSKSGTKNKYIYLNVWNTKCVPCIKEIPQIDSIAKLYNNEIDFVFISDDSESKVQKLLAKKQINIKNCIILNDEEATINYLCEQKKISKSYPLHFIINENIEITHYHSGAITGSIFDPILVSELNKILNKR